MTLHTDHPHVHGPGCGHLALAHGDHTCYAHDGHLHRPTDAGVEECVIAVDAAHPDGCGHGHDCDGHDAGHVHGPGCGHPAVPHGDHVDYVVNGHLHHPHDGHCDHHGLVAVA